MGDGRCDGRDKAGMRAVAGGEIYEGYVGGKVTLLGEGDQKAGITIM